MKDEDNKIQIMKGVQMLETKKLKYILVAGLLSISIFLVFGIPTALIPTGFFVRMLPANVFDYIFLLIVSILLGSFISLHFYYKKRNSKGEYKAVGGGIAGIFAFGCSICNVILVSLLGITGVLTLYEPIRIYVGILAIGLLIFALYNKLNFKKCKRC